MLTFAYSYHDPLLDGVSSSDWAMDADRVYHDLGDRQQWQQLMADCQETPPDRVLVMRLEDLGDSVVEVGDRLAQLEELGILVIALDAPLGDDPLCDPCSPDGETPVRRSDLLRFFQSLSDRQRSRRLRKGHAQNRVKALPPPGRAPYGYRRGSDRYTLDRTTAPIVKAFFEHFILYGSLRGSVRYLQKKYNKRISASTGKRWLSSPVYRGDLVYQNGDVVPDAHSAILSRQEAAQVDRLLRRNRQLPPRTASAPRSLAGLVTCGECQSSMKVTRVTRRGKSGEYLYLQPTTCQRPSRCRAIPYDQILQQVIEQICQELPQTVAGVELPDLDLFKARLNKQITEKEEILQSIPALLTQGILDQETAEWRAYKLRTDMAELRSQLAQLPPINLKAIAQTVSIPQFWLDLSESERRFYFREFIWQIRLIRDGTAWAIQLVFVFNRG